MNIDKMHCLACDERVLRGSCIPIIMCQPCVACRPHTRCLCPFNTAVGMRRLLACGAGHAPAYTALERARVLRLQPVIYCVALGKIRYAFSALR
jgi:hypothetical protein